MLDFEKCEKQLPDTQKMFETLGAKIKKILPIECPYQPSPRPPHPGASPKGPSWETNPDVTKQSNMLPFTPGPQSPPHH